jgi:hypothetical protein
MRMFSVTWVFIFQKKRKKKTKAFTTYIFVKLLNQDEAKDKIIWNVMIQNNDKIMVEEVYLWINLYLKFTFDIFYFLKSISNKIEKGFMNVYKTNSTCKMSLCYCYMIASIL